LLFLLQFLLTSLLYYFISRMSANVDQASSETDIKHVCSSVGCGKPALMACPTCLKLGIPPSRFCSQDCFKASWSEHKLLHGEVKKARSAVDPTAIPNEFRGFNFTGPLRPCQKTPKRTVPAHIARPDYADHPNGFPLGEQEDKKNLTIKVYTPEEILGIREACRIGREVLDIGGLAVRAGITCDEIDRIVHEATIERDAYPSPLNYHMFPKSLCTSVNEVICHGIPDMRELREGDIVNLDISVYKNGFHADLNETFMVGVVDEKSYNLVKCAYDSLAAAIAQVRPGTMYRYCSTKFYSAMPCLPLSSCPASSFFQRPGRGHPQRD
jgi:methionyl aminopeptidase